MLFGSVNLGGREVDSGPLIRHGHAAIREPFQLIFLGLRNWGLGIGWFENHRIALMIVLITNIPNSNGYYYP